ncbi:MAG: glucosaminidase domain-containing protein, partial [Erysipelotrichaceae bacterium]|nr:glucosaminidase domain-containing protein [Erysipelotrichaceae bacterium]
MAYIRRICEVIICLLILIDPFVVCADDEKYLISDNNETIEEFDSYSDAYSYYQEHIDEYDNLIMSEGDTVIHMEYGIVEFMNDGACGIDIEYHSTEKDEDDYLNSCYGVDGAYLYTDKEGKKVYFVLSGDTGYTDIDNVILHPYEKLDVRPSLYENTEDHFIHKIKTQLEQDHYTYSLKLDDPLDSLEKDREYYSYDGHYFYDDFRVMTDDYRNGIRDNAVNAEAYYNYYQYLPYRTLTNYSVEDLNTYFSDVLGIDGRLSHYRDHDGDGAADEINRSQLYGELDDFLIYQYMYGTNGMMLLSTAISESSYGRSKKSYSENNLFSIAAYETQKELEHSRYDTIDNSIYSYSKYFISKMLANHMRSDYTGTYPGNRLSGINVSYCLDSYYGERCASSYYELDSKLGGRDRDVYALGIIKDAKSVTFYKDQELENKRYVVKDIDELSLVILAEHEDSYKIQTDYSFSQDCLYDFEDCIAYVRKDVFSEIVNGGNIFENEYVTVHYDFGDGRFRDYTSLDMKYRKDDVPLEPKAKREGYEFAGYDEELVAQYREIESIELSRKSVSAVGLN